MEKRGLSTVVATVLILLITVAIATIIFTFVIPYVRENLDRSTMCLPYQNYFQFEESLSYNNTEYSFNCFNSSSSGNLYLVSVKTSDANVSSGIEGFVLSFVSSNSKSIRVIRGEATSSNPGSIRMLNSLISSLSVPREGEVYTYVYNAGTDNFSYVELSPILNNGKLCPQTDKIEFKNCGSIIPLDTK